MKMQHGFAMITVLVVMSVLLILATTMTVTAISHSNMTLNTDFRQGAYNVAESGVADVMTKLGNGAITAAGGTRQDGSGSIGGRGSYTYTVTFNTTASPQSAVNPLGGGGTCNAVSQTQWDPGNGCVALPPNAIFVAVTGTYRGRTVSAEAMSTANNIELGTKTIATKNTSGQNGQNANIYASSDGAHDVDIISNGGWTVSGAPTADGTVATVSTNNQANAVTKITGAAPFVFPSSNNLQQAQSLWINDAKTDDCYYDVGKSTLPSNLTVPRGGTCYINGNLDFKDVHTSNDGGLLVVAGSVTETGDNSFYQLTAACQAICSCHQAAQLVVLSTAGASLHGAGTNNGKLQSQGIIYVPNGPYANIGNEAVQAAVIADSAQIGGTSGFTADACTRGALIILPGANIVAFGQH